MKTRVHLMFAAALLSAGALVSPAAASNSDVRSAQHEIARVVSDLRRDFENSQELRDARAAATQAMLSYRTVCNETIKTLQSDAAYRRAAMNVDAAERRLAAARVAFETDPSVTRKTLDTLARELLVIRAAESKLETAALKANPEVETARFAWMDANATVLGLQRDFSRSIQSSPEFVAARAKLEAAFRASAISR